MPGTWLTKIVSRATPRQKSISLGARMSLAASALSQDFAGMAIW
jgi:hypothetical protein